MNPVRSVRVLCLAAPLTLLLATVALSAPPESVSNTAEAAHYRIVTLPIPKDIVLEVGGLAARADGKLLACTRRGEVWLISNPNTDNPADVKYKLFATGLHEALGMVLDGKDVYVCQRPELTKLIDRDGDDVADEYVTVCDKWGVSGDYHEFAFGPARDRQGNFYITLNVGFAGGHQSKAPWRGWCVKITPKGELTPYATGLRSPNGVNVSPEGDLFYCDNQGEWVASCKLVHIRPGEYYGHPAGLRWVKQSPFAGKIPDKHISGMLYDGQKGPNGVSGRPPVTPPAIWFPYGRMGQSASEPIWDTTGGKFGPFAGQCFVGDQMRSTIMRVHLEKINGRYQGACFPFRSGFECGINRLAFGPDASLYAGMTNRGWGSVGGKPYGLQRLVSTGVLPFEIHRMKLTKNGFDLTFTKPLDAATARKADAYSLQSFTYNYWSTYGSPEVDRRAEKVRGVTVAADGKSVSLQVEGFRPGRVYELHLDGVKSGAGDPVLHPEAYYTLNEIPR
jgi:glucose/arabinose dehydrogenase